MKALVFEQGLAIEEIPVPVPQAGEARIRVAYCGVCHSDLHVLKEHTPFPRPCVLGHEISGTVDALGDGVDGLSVGQRVVCSFVIPCGRCRACAAGHDELCIPFLEENRTKGHLYDGRSRLAREDGTPIATYSMGGLAELCCVPVTDVFPLPEGLGLRDASIIGCSSFTAFGATHNVGQVGLGDRVAVIGAGGVGSSVIQMCRLAGAASVIAVDVDEARREPSLALGATRFVNSRLESPLDAVSEETGGWMADVAIEALGLPDTVRLATELLHEGGRAVIVGLPSESKTAELDIGRMVKRRLALHGSYGAHTRADMPVIVAAAASGHLRSGQLISREFPLEQAAAAYHELEQGRIVGRAVIAIDGAQRQESTNEGEASA